jgi:hypothetical protein
MQLLKEKLQELGDQRESMLQDHTKQLEEASAAADRVRMELQPKVAQLMEQLKSMEEHHEKELDDLNQAQKDAIQEVQKNAELKKIASLSEAEASHQKEMEAALKEQTEDMEKMFVEVLETDLNAERQALNGRFDEEKRLLKEGFDDEKR